jgi:hypothetical protein
VTIKKNLVSLLYSMFSYKFPNSMTLKNTLYLALGMASVSMLACKSNGGNQPAEKMGSVAAVASSTNYQPKTVVHPPTKLGNLMNLDTPTSGNFQASAAGYNPAHGQPGHTCDLAVGAPLGGSSAPQASPAAALAQTSSPNFKVDANTKLNPAHGEPGHDCAVAVGEPLPSADLSKAAATPVPSGLGSLVEPVPASIAAPSLTAPAIGTPNLKVNTTGTVGAKINPAHGQPGHDCAVAVGAPLPG